MNLLEIAESDLAITIEDKDNGFGVQLSLFDEKEKEYPIVVNVSDIGYFIDPQTGIGIIGRQVEISIRISSLISQTLGDQPDDRWSAKYTDKSGVEWTMFVASAPKVDRTLGIYNITLESYKKNDTET